MSSKLEKTLDNLEVGDNLKSGNGSKYIVAVVLEKSIIVANNTQGGQCFIYGIQYLKDNGWIVEAPLTTAQKMAKECLEAIGFKVTR